MYGEDSPRTNESPFPKFAKPFPAECWAARDFLASLYGEPQREAPEEAERKRRAGIKRAEEGGDKGSAGPGCWTEGYAKKSVLDSVVGTILSQNTTDLTSARAMKKLKESMPDWETVRSASPEDVMALIKEGGLAQTKTERIQAMLNTIKVRRERRQLNEKSLDVDVCSPTTGATTATLSHALVDNRATHDFHPLEGFMRIVRQVIHWNQNPTGSVNAAYAREL